MNKILWAGGFTILCVLSLVMLQISLLPSRHALETNNHAKPQKEKPTNLPSARPASQMDIEPLPQFSKRAEIVVVGRLKSVSVKGPSVRQQGKQKLRGQDMEGELEVQTVYKGNLQLGETLIRYFLSEAPFTIYAPLKTGGVSLFFLKQAEGGVAPYYPARPYFPVLEKRPQLKNGYSVEDAVNAELLQNIGQGDQNLAQLSLMTLGSGTDEAMAVAKRVSESNRPLAVKAAAVAYRIRNGDKEALDTAVEIVEKAPDQQMSEIVATIATVLPIVAKDVSPKQARILFSTKNVSMHSALGLVIVENSSPPFAALAVDMLKASTSGDGQYDGLIVLSRLRHINGPDLEQFIQERQKYITEYSAWWEREGKQKYGELGPK